MTSTIPASCGHPYRLRKTGRLYSLNRRSMNGRDNLIVMDKPAAIAICNQLIDLIEQDKHT